MPRLFAALELPEEAREQLTELEAPLPGARWIEHDELHLTLRFAGDIDNRQARDFAEALASIDRDVLEIRLVGLGAFGGNDPRALWAGVAPNPALDQLARDCERAARQAGLPPEARAFKPHVTIARLRGTRVDAVARYLQHNGAFRLEPFVAERFVLFSARPGAGGGPYVVEEEFPLRGGMLGEGIDDDADHHGVDDDAAG